MVCTYCNTPLPEQSRFCSICGAFLSDPELTTRQRAAVKGLFDAVKVAVKDRYLVTDMLGRGGMGAVFLAEDLRLGRLVAIKVLRPEYAEESAAVARFQREVRIAARLDHPNIIPVYAVEEVGDFHYFVMKYMPGKSLDELLTGQPLGVEQTRLILLQAARGLGHAHQRGVIHRDVKPSNIMLADDGQVVIADFGISKALHAKTQYTSTGQMLGTPQYLSPEQARDLPVDGRSDQYSLGVVGYQMLVGRPPLIGESVHSLLYKHIYEEPTPAHLARPEVPEDLSRALQRALSKKPEDRFATMEEFADAVWSEREHGQPAPAGTVGDRVAARAHPDHPVPLVGRAISRSRRRRTTAVGAALATLAVAGIVVAALRGNRREAPATTEQVQTAAESGTQQAPGSSDSAETPSGAPPATSAETRRPSPDTASTASPESAATAPEPPAPPKPRPIPRARKASPPPTDRRPRPDTTAAAPRAPVPSVGYVTINAVPYGTVSIDGVEVGDTPIVRHELAPGPHIIRIVRDGFRAESTTAMITAGNEVRLSRTLVKETQ